MERIFVNGQFADSTAEKSKVIVNPATEEEIAEIPLCGEKDVEQAVAAARKAFFSWGATTPAERSALLLKIADRVEQHLESLALIESQNVGKPLEVARFDVCAFVDNLRFFAGAARTLQGLSCGEYMEGHTSMIRREPVGVVGSITPWNYPLLMAGWKIGPALAAGNTVVLKPSELTPLSALKLAELTADLLPPGVLNVVTGLGEEAGAALARHPGVHMISLTGSVRAGKAVAREASAALKKVHLELGGKAPVVIFDDADLDEAVNGIRLAGFSNSGQDCTAAARIYVEKGSYEALLDKLAAAAQSIVVGDPLTEGTEMGPLVSQEHLERVAGFVERARSKPQVQVLAGGERLEGRGFFYKPTVLAGVSQSDEIIREEVFGPVVTVMPFASEDEAMELANDCQYALSTSVWTQNTSRAMKFVKQLQYGTVWVNTHFLLTSEMPHGGFKNSGYGKDQSIYAVEEYTEIKHAMIRFA
ncbi:gamma-aminobutyraldehyde dehydrogenase [Brevibacillus sp. B_LB10_24]|uniref:gamma-aminobutyraldehyde dehydrogenase n=1 Tax=Brevibacillus sp. B_LB10_24 TaxID=3380645 RepID=UPI0038BDF66C